MIWLYQFKTKKTNKSGFTEKSILEQEGAVKDHRGLTINDARRGKNAHTRKCVGYHKASMSRQDVSELTGVGAGMTDLSDFLTKHSAVSVSPLSPKIRTLRHMDCNDIFPRLAHLESRGT